MSNPIVTAAVSRLKYPWLLALTITVLVIDLLIPDFVPFIDEIFLATMTAVFTLWRERRQVPMKTVSAPPEQKVLSADSNPPKLP